MKKSLSPKRPGKKLNAGRKQRKLDMGHFVPPRTKRPASLWALLPSAKSATTTTATMSKTANSRIVITNMMKLSTCNMCKRWGPPCPFVPNPFCITHPRSQIGKMRTGMEIVTEQESYRENRRKRKRRNKRRKMRNNYRRTVSPQIHICPYS